VTNREEVISLCLALAVGVLAYGAGGREARAIRQRSAVLTDSVRLLNARYAWAMARDSLLEEEMTHRGERVQALQNALRHTISSGTAQVDTLRLLVPDTTAQRLLDGLETTLATAQARVDSLVAECAARDSLAEVRRKDYERLLADWRRLATSAVTAPAVPHTHTLRTLAYGALAGAVLWEIAR